MFTSLIFTVRIFFNVKTKLKAFSALSCNATVPKIVYTTLCTCRRQSCLPSEVRTVRAKSLIYSRTRKTGHSSVISYITAFTSSSPVFLLRGTPFDWWRGLTLSSRKCKKNYFKPQGWVAFYAISHQMHNQISGCNHFPGICLPYKLRNMLPAFVALHATIT